MSPDTLYEKRYVEVAKTSEIEPGQLKHVEIEKKEILIANIDGKFYSLDDRCSHMNASLAKGKVIGKDVVCAFHAAKFNIPSGAVVNPAVMSPLPLDQLPPQIKSYFESVGPLMMSIKTYDQKTYGLKIEDGKILVAV
jgi:nitrite reductase/ring-hydroxylating ferredoxin subunit